MTNLSTTYLGLELKNPIIVGSSELCNTVEHIISLEKAGAGAVIIKSLFEEQIMMDVNAERTNNMFETYGHIEDYVGYYLKQHSITKHLDLIKDAKKAVDIPIIGSINCVSSSEWMEYAKNFEDAGADALEINLFILPANEDMSSEEIEAIYMDIATQLPSKLNIPVSLKLSSYFSGMTNFLVKLSKTEIKGMVLFNKFYNLAIDIENEKINSRTVYSSPEDNSNTLRWIGILDGKVDCDLASSTGVHTGEDVISNILVGANAVQMVSSIFINGDSQITKVKDELSAWMEKKGYENISDFHGKLSQTSQKNPMLFERAQFMKYFADSGR
ncbi:MAG: dihydroorotate dehydrogenase-like protein [Bacteroidota bacterium]